MKNITVLIFATVAVFMAALAVFFRPVRLTGYQSQAETTSQKPSTTSRIYSPSSASYPQVDEALTVKESTTTMQITASNPQVKKAAASQKETATAQNKKKESKLVSRLHEIAEREKEWLEEHEHTTQPSMTPAEFRKAGVIYYNGYKFTYYSEKVLPGPGLKIPGRHSDGNFVRDGDGYIVLASCDLPKGTVVQTPFGPGKVYDYCPTSGTIDVYVSW